MLLERGANPNFHSEYTSSSLIEATENGRVRIIELLLENNADINIRNFRGQTALMIASLMGYGYIVYLLLEKGADPNITDFSGQTPLMIALQKGHTEIARFIREHIDLQRIQRAQQNLAFMKYFLDRDDLDLSLIHI